MDWFSYVIIGVIGFAFVAIVVVNIVTKGRRAMKPHEFKGPSTDIPDTTHGGGGGG